MKNLLDFISLADWLALLWFAICWIGYAGFAARKAKYQPTLASSLSSIRGLWMSRIFTREVRIADVTALGILQRNVTFFASTTIFILAGLLTVLGATDQVVQLTNTLPFIVENTRASWEVKLLVLIFIFVYAFFKFAWSVRQYNFAIVLLGAAPSNDASETEKSIFVVNANEVLTRANNSFAHGLRAYSFAMAVLGWFIHPILFAGCALWIVLVLHRREFHSNTLDALQAAGLLKPKQ
ncbi:MAG: DUF599 domain-containing protein [Gammaproteobacteria bacterium]|nr:DUF599 domain-containing protein [Gammaproteobacteria bacterium]NVK88627.1 DUF599 domain-containing protein [Gammaproteobacteria bacterium]